MIQKSFDIVCFYNRSGDMIGEPFIDDYISTQEQVTNIKLLWMNINMNMKTFGFEFIPDLGFSYRSLLWSFPVSLYAEANLRGFQNWTCLWGLKVAIRQFVCTVSECGQYSMCSTCILKQYFKGIWICVPSTNREYSETTPWILPALQYFNHILNPCTL